MTGSLRAQILERIVKLKEHAEGVAASYPAEAESFRAKALELMQQYGISHAEVRSAAAPPVEPERESSKRPGTVVGRGRAQPQRSGAPLTIEIRLGSFRARWKL